MAWAGSFFLNRVIMTPSFQVWATCAHATVHFQIRINQGIIQGRAARISSAVIPSCPGLRWSLEDMRPFSTSTRVRFWWPPGGGATAIAALAHARLGRRLVEEVSEKMYIGEPFYLTRIWIFIIPPVLLAEKRAHDWVWAAVPRPARRRLRRIWSDASRSKTIEEE